MQLVLLPRLDLQNLVCENYHVKMRIVPLCNLGIDCGSRDTRLQ
jgi:hypothetical protein